MYHHAQTVIFIFFEESPHVVQVGLQLVILLLQHPQIPGFGSVDLELGTKEICILEKLDNCSRICSSKKI
jgi:hypothetical protein